MKPKRNTKRFSKTRPLNAGEVIQKFDQYIDISSGNWKDSGCVGETYNPKPGGHCRHRRFL